MKIFKILFQILLVAAVLILGIFLGISHSDNKKNVSALENIYQKSFYELNDEIVDMTTKLNKLKATSSPKVQEKLLMGIKADSEVAVDNFGQLNIRDSSTEWNRFLNQVGDYSDYLARKLYKGEKLSAEDRETLAKIAKVIESLGQQLNGLKDRIGSGYLFMENLGETNYLTTIIGCKSENSVEYPKLIYDGPFSDALQDKEAKFLKNLQNVTEEQARDEIKKVIGNVTDIKLQQTISKPYEIYVFTAKADGRTYDIEVTKKGGKLILIDGYQQAGEAKLKDKECSELAKQYLDKLGYKDMEEVWVMNNHNIMYINFAPKIGGVIYYPDLIKVKVACDNGAILGLEAKNYILNHTDRTLNPVRIELEDAVANLEGGLKFDDGRMALIPTECNMEILCYELLCNMDGNTYLLYVDVTSGDEVDVQMIVDGENGKMLI